MSDGALLRLELALGALAVTAASVVLVIAADAVQFHAAALWQFPFHDLGAHGVLLLALVVVDGGVIARRAVARAPARRASRAGAVPARPRRDRGRRAARARGARPVIAGLLRGAAAARGVRVRGHS
jgi:hypothetical protein